MLVQVSQIKINSAARTLGVLQAVVGAFTGVVFTIIAIFDPQFVQTDVGGSIGVFGIWSFIILPVLNGFLGFTTGLVIGTVYNFCVKFFQIGVQIDIEET